MDRFILSDTDKNIVSADVEYSFLEDDDDFSDAGEGISEEEDAFAGKNNKFNRLIVVICCSHTMINLLNTHR